MGKKIPMWQCLVIILVMLAFLLWEIVVCQDGEGHLALIRAAIFAAIIAVANGWKWTFLEQGIIAAISRSMQAMLILMMVGLLIGSWIPGGVIPSIFDHIRHMVWTTGPSLMGGVILGVICMAFQGIVNPKAYMLTLNYGFVSENVNPDLVELLSGGGMQNMMWTISLIMCAMVFGGIVDCTGVMCSFAGVLMKVARGTRGGLVCMTIFSCIFVNAVCCDQYLAIILPGRMFKESFEDMRLKPKNLSRCLEDAGTITSQFFPWNTCGATMRTFLGVNQWGAGGYAPYAILNWLNPLISIFYGFTGISMEKMTEEEYQKVLEEREAEKLAALKALEA